LLQADTRDDLVHSTQTRYSPPVSEPSVVLAPVEVRDSVAHHQSGVADFNAAVEEVKREEQQRDLDTKRDDRLCRGCHVKLTLYIY